MFEAKDLIKQAIERYGDNIAVACSFGKDSMVVLHMALELLHIFQFHFILSPPFQ